MISFKEKGKKTNYKTMDRSDSQVISQCNTLKRSILLCIHDEVRVLLDVANLFCGNSTFILRKVS